MSKILKGEIHSSFTSGASTWEGYRQQVVDLFVSGVGSGALFGQYSQHIIREYNNKIDELGQAKDLFIEPFTEGFAYNNNPLLGTVTGGNQSASGCAAYSTRTVGFGGPIMRVRRESDNEEVDVRGDKNGEVSLASPILATGTASVDANLGAFVGTTGNAFCSIWYDQAHTGSFRLNANQTSANAQPAVVSLGSLIQINEKTSLRFDGSNDYMITDAFSPVFSQPNTVTAVAENAVTGDSTRRYLFNGRTSSNRNFIAKRESENWYAYAGTVIESSSAVDLNPALLVAEFNGAPSTVTKNGSIIITGNLGSDSLDGITIGQNYGGIGNPWSGKIAELVCWNGLASISEIGDNVNGYYNIY
tara:strand:- start:698 stop:1777 length:1080 start_codon:yes stop_codon:yes gene_type:complete